MNSGIVEELIEALSHGPGYFVDREFLSAHEVRELNADFESHSPLFRPAGVGRGRNFKAKTRIRGDRIYWFEPSILTETQKRLWSKLNELRLHLNRSLFLSLSGIEGHYALYAAGAGYEKHVDRHLSSDARVISVVLYLNPNWKPGDGGELLIYDGSRVAERIEPRAGTLVCFLSDRVVHEVAKAHRPRRSFAGWLRQRT